MNSIRSDVIGGFNSFIAGQKSGHGEATLSLFSFSDTVTDVYNFQDLQTIEELSSELYIPNGTTALHDAIGIAIDRTGRFLNCIDEDKRPGRVLVAIITDGEENSSKEYTADRIKEMINHQRDVYNWEFDFLAANQDASLTASTIGIKGTNAVNISATTDGMHALWSGYTTRTTLYRSGDTTADLTDIITPSTSDIPLSRDYVTISN